MFLVCRWWYGHASFSQCWDVEVSFYHWARKRANRQVLRAKWFDDHDVWDSHQNGKFDLFSHLKVEFQNCCVYRIDFGIWFFRFKNPKPRCKVEVTGNMPMPGGGSSVIVDKPFEVWNHPLLLTWWRLFPDRCRKIYRSSPSKGTGFGGDDRHRELDFVELRFINWIPIVDPADWCVLKLWIPLIIDHTIGEWSKTTVGSRCEVQKPAQPLFEFHRGTGFSAGKIGGSFCVNFEQLQLRK